MTGQALIRGRYMSAVGAMQFNGTPIDSDVFTRLQKNWPALKSKLIARVDAAFGVYERGSFKEALFEAYLAKHGIAWPRLVTGRLKLDRDTFSSMSKRHPQIRPLHELRKTLGELRLNGLAVGDDGRNRTMLSPFSSKTTSLPTWSRLKSSRSPTTKNTNGALTRNCCVTPFIGTTRCSPIADRGAGLSRPSARGIGLTQLTGKSVRD